VEDRQIEDNEKFLIGAGAHFEQMIIQQLSEVWSSNSRKREELIRAMRKLMIRRDC